MYSLYTRDWPVLNFFNALVNDFVLAKEFDQASAGGKGEILRHFRLDPALHLSLFTPSGAPLPLTEADIRKILDEAIKEILAKMPANFW